ncbi:MAG: hypothetical protein ACI9YU_002072 [Flavobacteriales bacterium]|jgi:hypothetical protein
MAAAPLNQQIITAMKKQFLIIISLASSGFCQGQEVIATSGQTHTSGPLIISQTVGEAVIHKHATGISIDQGFHQYEEIVVNPVNVLEESGIKVSVYPNPFVRSINISSEEDLELIKVYSLSGAEVASQMVGTNQRSAQLDLSDLSQGQYLLRVQAIGASEASTYKLIKQ